MLLRQRKAEETKQILRKLVLLVKIYSLDEKIINLALNDIEFNDFEDGLQYYTALENHTDIILTRNTKDFKNSKLPVITAKQFNEIIE